MKSLIQLTCLLALMATVSKQQTYRHTESYPKLQVTAVSIPPDKTKPLQTAVTLSCVGPTPLALAQDQFSVSISTEKNPFRYDGDAIFPPDSPKIFRLNPNEKIDLVIFTSRDRLPPRKAWRTLPAGKYILKVYLNSGKAERFDVQWLGQTYSNEYTLRINH